MNPNNEVERNRLFKAMEISYRQLAPFRRLVVGLVEEYAGSGYGHDGSRPRYEILLNLMNQAVDAYTMSLAANRPRIMVSTQSERFKFFARHFQTATNNLIQEIELENTLRQAVLDAFFCVGFVKVHMADTVPVKMAEGVLLDPGTPYASNIPLDNWCHDISATQWRAVKFAADSYRIPFEDLKDSMFDQGACKDLSPTTKYAFSDGDDRVESISKGYETDADEFEPMIDLMDVWIPREGKIFTFPMDPKRRFSTQHKPVADMKWDGPEFGPYHRLSFNDVPENIMPSSPASHLAGMARLVNNLMRKQSRQSRRQKDVYTYTPAGADSAKRIQRTDDGQWVEVQSKDDVSVLKMGGVDSGNQAFMLGVVQMFDRMAGNLQAMAGLGPQAETLGQEQLIYGAVSKKEAQMQYRTLDFSRRVIRDLGFMLWNDRVKTIPGRISVDEVPGYQIESPWTPQDRLGDFYDYSMDIDIFSMAYQSPTQRIKSINQLLTQIYAPLAQMMQAQGGRINFRKITDTYAELLNLPQLKEILEFQEPQQQAAPMGSGEGPGMPSNTSREYVRRSIPSGGTAAGRAHVEQQAWIDMAGQNNPDQTAQLTR